MRILLVIMTINDRLLNNSYTSIHMYNILSSMISLLIMITKLFHTTKIHLLQNNPTFIS